MKDSVAIYWDFENVHAALLEDRYGPGSYARSRFRPQEPVVDVGAVVGYAATIGDIVVNRAYGNWQWFGRYRDELLSNAVELIQVFPAGGYGKNGADIRLVLDSLDHIMRLRHITHVVVVGGDSDFIGLAERCRRLGRTMIGVGVEGSVNHYWIKSCSEFKYYKTLLSKTASHAAEILHELREEADVGDVRLLFVKAVSNLSTRSAHPQGVLKAAIKPMMMRLDPTFDEGNFGFSSFEELLAACKDLVSFTIGEHDHMYRLTERGQALLAGKKLAPEDHGDSEGEQALHTWIPHGDEAAEYAKILKRGKVRPLTPEFRDAAIEETCHVFAQADPPGRLESFEAFRSELSKHLRIRGIDHNARDLNAFRQMLYRLRLFKLLKENGGGIALNLSEVSAEKLRRTVLAKTTEWVARYSPSPVEEAPMSELLLGPNGSATERGWVGRMLESLHEDA